MKIEKYWDRQQQQQDPIIGMTQAAKDICKQRFGFYTDPYCTPRKNLDHLRKHTDPEDMPREPDNLQLHNLCSNKSLITDNLLETLGLGLGHGIALEQKDENPIDFERLQILARLQFADFDKDTDNDFNPKLYVKGSWLPEPVPPVVEAAINDLK